MLFFSRKVISSDLEKGALLFIIIGKASQIVSVSLVCLARVKYFLYLLSKNEYKLLKFSLRALPNLGNFFSCSNPKAEDISSGKKLYPTSLNINLLSYGIPAILLPKRFFKISEFAFSPKREDCLPQPRKTTKRSTHLGS